MIETRAETLGPRVPGSTVRRLGLAAAALALLGVAGAALFPGADGPAAAPPAPPTQAARLAAEAALQMNAQAPLAIAPGTVLTGAQARGDRIVASLTLSRDTGSADMDAAHTRIEAETLQALCTDPGLRGLIDAGVGIDHVHTDPRGRRLEGRTDSCAGVPAPPSTAQFAM